MTPSDNAFVLNEAEIELLLAHLREERDVQAELLANLEAKKELLVAQDASGLESHLVDGKEVLDRLDAVARRRGKVLVPLFDRAGLAPGRARVSDLVANLPVHRQAELRALRDEVREVATRVRQANNRNNVLLKHTMDFNQAIVRSMFSVDSTPDTYDRAGATRSETSTRILDRTM